MRGWGNRWRSGTALALVLLMGAVWAGSAWAQGGHLEVRRISPSGTDVTPGQEAVIQFDRKMVSLGRMGRKTSTLPVSIRPDPGCQWRWLNTSELACRLPQQHRFAPAPVVKEIYQPDVFGRAKARHINVAMPGK